MVTLAGESRGQVLGFQPWATYPLGFIWVLGFSSQLMLLQLLPTEPSPQLSQRFVSVSARSLLEEAHHSFHPDASCESSIAWLAQGDGTSGLRTSRVPTVHCYMPPVSFRDSTLQGDDKWNRGRSETPQGWCLQAHSHMLIRGLCDASVANHKLFTGRGCVVRWLECSPNGGREARRQAPAQLWSCLPVE